jgi:hypothetical protein
MAIYFIINALYRAFFHGEADSRSSGKVISDLFRDGKVHHPVYDITVNGTWSDVDDFKAH